jgi:hypothetical protein
VRRWGGRILSLRPAAWVQPVTDLTRDRIAELLGRKLRHDPSVEEQIRHYFESRGRTVPSRTRVEALVPEGAVVLPNRHGTAPGLMIEVAPNPFRINETASVLLLLPGRRGVETDVC